MATAIEYWNTFFWLWVALFLVAAFVFLWAVLLRDYRRRHGLDEFHAAMPETQRNELREHLADEYERGAIDAEEYRRRLDELER